MFFVFNKPKIYSYLIVLSTVVVLFFTAEVLSEANNIEVLTTSAEITDSMIIERFNTNEKEIAITINCLETDKNIEKILEISDKYNVKFSFAMCGEWVKRYPQLVKKINEKENNIISLTNHYEDISSLNYENLKKNITEGINKINKLLNKNITTIRCPYGKSSDNVIKIAQENNYKIIEWSIDTLDYQGLEPSAIWDNIKNKITPGDIILTNSNSEHIIDELEMIVKKVQDRGYKIIDLEEKL